MHIKQFPAEFRVILAVVALFLGWLFAAIIPYDYPLGKEWGFRLPVERLGKAKDSVQPTLLPGGLPPTPVRLENGISAKNDPASSQKNPILRKNAGEKEKVLPRRSMPGSEYIVLDETNLKNIAGKEKSGTIRITNKPNFDMEILEPEETRTNAQWISKGDAAKREEEIKQFARELETDEFDEPAFEKKKPLRWEDHIKPKLEGSNPTGSSTAKKEIPVPKTDPVANMDKPTVKTAVVPEKKNTVIQNNPPAKKIELPKNGELPKADPEKIALPKPDKVLSNKKVEINTPEIKPEGRIVADPKKMEGSLQQPIPLADSKDSTLVLRPLNIPKDPVSGSLADPSRQTNPNHGLNQGNIVLIPTTIPEEKSGQIRSSSHLETVPRFASPDPNAILVPAPAVNSGSSSKGNTTGNDPGSIVYLKPNVQPDQTTVARISTENTPISPVLSELKIHIVRGSENPESLRKLYGLSEKKYAYLLSLNKNRLDPNGHFPDGTKVFIP